MLVIVETLTRLVGVTDVPTYNTDDQIGYIPKPDQSGSFLRSHDWVFNDRSMGTAAPWDPGKRPNVLLIGNSIVMGGNPFDQKDKLGPQLQRQLGESYAIWPIAAGGWTNINEIAYLKRNPDVAANAQFFVWEYMSGGLSALSRWHSDYTWPRNRPVLASWYAFQRYLAPKMFHMKQNELPPVGSIAAGQLERFKASLAMLCHGVNPGCSGMLFLYPARGELAQARAGRAWLPEEAEIRRVAETYGLTVVDIARAPQWNETLYRPDGVHPTKEGNAVLAGILSRSFAQRFAQAMK